MISLKWMTVPVYIVLNVLSNAKLHSGMLYGKRVTLIGCLIKPMTAILDYRFTDSIYMSQLRSYYEILKHNMRKYNSLIL